MNLYWIIRCLFSTVLSTCAIYGFHLSSPDAAHNIAIGIAVSLTALGITGWIMGDGR